jgi:hypothetical protein
MNGSSEMKWHEPDFFSYPRRKTGSSKPERAGAEETSPALGEELRAPDLNRLEFLGAKTEQLQNSRGDLRRLYRRRDGRSSLRA